MPALDITEKRSRINIFKLNKAYYFKHFFYDPELFRELEPYYEKASYRFKMATAGERNKIMKLWIEKAMTQIIKYGQILKNSIDTYPLRDKIVLVMMDMGWVVQLAMGATMRTS